MGSRIAPGAEGRSDHIVRVVIVVIAAGRASHVIGEVLVRVRRSRAVGFAILEELDGLQASVQPLAVLVVLRPDLDHRVDIAAGVGGRLPAGLSLRESMILGTAGFTAALALLRMQDNRQTPALGPLAVTGATGGVGSLAIAIFVKAGFEVHAISGKPEHAAYLKALGASEVLGRDALSTNAPMGSARFGGGLDNVGGPMLASLLAQTAPYGNVASAGLAASPELSATVMPFIIRGVSLLGVASAGTARDIRDEVWRRLSSEWKPAGLETICTRNIGLDGLPDVFGTMLASGSLGRTVVQF